jgi:hypothetical protein
LIVESFDFRHIFEISLCETIATLQRMLVTNFTTYDTLKNVTEQYGKEGDARVETKLLLLMTWLPFDALSFASNLIFVKSQRFDRVLALQTMPVRKLFT